MTHLWVHFTYSSTVIGHLLVTLFNNVTMAPNLITTLHVEWWPYMAAIHGGHTSVCKSATISIHSTIQVQLMTALYWRHKLPMMAKDGKLRSHDGMWRSCEGHDDRIDRQTFDHVSISLGVIRQIWHMTTDHDHIKSQRQIWTHINTYNRSIHITTMNITDCILLCSTDYSIMTTKYSTKLHRRPWPEVMMPLPPYSRASNLLPSAV